MASLQLGHIVGPIGGHVCCGLHGTTPLGRIDRMLCIDATYYDTCRT